LIVSAKRQADKSRRTFNEALRVQAAAREEKQKALRDNKMKAAEEMLIDASYLHQQYDSPRCWRSEKQSFEIMEQLKFKKDRLSSVKEQILIRYLDLGWVEAHHPWSKKGHSTYSAAELLEHFLKVVLPLKKLTQSQMSRHLHCQVCQKASADSVLGHRTVLILRHLWAVRKWDLG
jgi:hypothetical protein